MDDGGILYTIGYDHSLAENALLYLVYSKVENDANANFTITGDGHGDSVVPTIGKDASGFSLGIVYDF